VRFVRSARTGRTVDAHRITPFFGDRCKGLLVDALPLIRWETDSSTHPLPDEIQAEWHGNPKGSVSVARGDSPAAEDARGLRPDRSKRAKERHRAGTSAGRSTVERGPV
jgi:hypothetical protein